MLHRALSHIALVLVGSALASCSGGSAAGSGDSKASCTGGQVMCLSSCNLGCSSAGCNLTEIAQNQPIILVFSRDVDPRTVNSASVSFKTSAGEEPVGTYLVNRQVVTFTPEVRVVGSQTFFGFRANETYIMTVHGGANDPNAVRSTSGDPLLTTVVCNLLVNKGIVDLDQSPPRATLISPSPTINVPRDAKIVLGFSEIIDHTPFLNTTSANSPIRVRLRKTRQGPNGPECNPGSLPTNIEGSWRLVNDIATGRTTASFNTLVQFPGTICGEVEVTGSVRDLAGTPAQPQLFQFVTEPASAQELSIVEAFENDLQMDRDASGGTWTNRQATPGPLGGDALHGDFEITDGTRVNDVWYRWDTRSMVIDRNTPLSTRTLTGRPETVTDGLFRFSSFFLPRGYKLEVIGDKPMRIQCAGKFEVQGEIVLSAPNMLEHDGNALGQAGGNGGPGAGRGGAGSRTASGSAPGFDGATGENVVVPAGHAYASRVAGTGGKGSVQFPLSGLNNDVTWGYIDFFSTQIAAGGGGGGSSAGGRVGKAVLTYNNRTQDLGPDAPGGALFDAFPIPVTTPTFDHFMINGAGGGGGGSHPYFSIKPSTFLWRSGAGGGGGGGAFGLRAGGDLTMVSNTKIEARGGSGFPSVNATVYPTPAGGGGGGSILLQAAGSVTMNGLIDFRGGTGGSLILGVYNLETRGGDGGEGFLRLEVPGTQPPPPSILGQTQPPASTQNVANLRDVDHDTVVTMRSKWYPTRQVFPPDYLRYEVMAMVGSSPIRFSDDPTKGVLATTGQAVRFYVQGGDLDANGKVIPESIRPWRRLVGSFSTSERSLNEDSITAFRFILQFDRSVNQSIVGTQVAVFYRA
jgi:hypothetical protein